MTTLQERKKRGEEIVKKYKTSTSVDFYALAVDAIADVLLFVAQGEGESTQILHAAEMDFRNAAEGEAFASEG